MREVTVSRVVAAAPTELSAWLEPATIVEAEGSFAVERVEERDGTTVVVASGPGLQLPLRFEDRDGTIYYTQESERGPFSAMETSLETDPVDHGRTRLAARSAVELAAPLPFGDRIAAWKRRGELTTLLESAEAAFE
ncbi:polyketide cyclase [Natrinema saccharevitans]|uniref:Polyketide cyclase n=1 Tax=Natrinema saccharevitans TaxID=301967 RepID=A0A1S8AUC4_9EURY|nr:polyketide cyclase [Natrinema saccharevitans]OLZ40216.1 polyketide cyclase [Natrinema saccharevitans]